MDYIKQATIEEIKDSRNKPTLRVVIKTTKGYTGLFDVPSGASTGKHEAMELRDEDGVGVSKAIEIFNTEVAPMLDGMQIDKQKQIDDALLKLDGTENKSRLGAGSILGVSIASARAASAMHGVPLHEYLSDLAEVEKSFDIPRLFVNLINGGSHGKNGSPFQEHHIIPLSDNLKEAFEIAKNIQNALRELLNTKKIPYTIGDEGGFVFPVDGVHTPFELLSTAVLNAGYTNQQVSLGADIAASSFFNTDTGEYNVLGKQMSASVLLSIYKTLHEKYDLNYIEDPFHEEDFSSFARLSRQEPEMTIIGDDLTTTNIERIITAVEAKSINAVIIKPNQIGTITETIESIVYAKNNDIKCIVSHRSGETFDTAIADIVRAFKCFGLKAGAPDKAERKVKYDRLIKIS